MNSTLLRLLIVVASPFLATTPSFAKNPADWHAPDSVAITASDVQQQNARRVKKTVEDLELNDGQRLAAEPVLRGYFSEKERLFTAIKTGNKDSRMAARKSSHELDRALRSDLSSTLTAVQMRALDRRLLLTPDKDLVIVQNSSAKTPPSPLAREDSTIRERSAAETLQILDRLRLDEQAKSNLEPALFSYLVAALPVANFANTTDSRYARQTALSVLARLRLAFTEAASTTLGDQQLAKAREILLQTLDTSKSRPTYTRRTSETDSDYALYKNLTAAEKMEAFAAKAVSSTSQNKKHLDRLERIATRETQLTINELGLSDAQKSELEYTLHNYHLAHAYIGQPRQRTERKREINPYTLDKTLRKALVATLNERQRLKLEQKLLISGEAIFDLAMRFASHEQNTYPITNDAVAQDPKKTKTEKAATRATRQTIQKLQLENEQRRKVELNIYHYYYARYPVAQTFWRTDDHRERRQARRVLDSLDRELKESIAQHLLVEQRLALKAILERNQEALEPLPYSPWDADEYEYRDYEAVFSATAPAT